MKDSQRAALVLVLAMQAGIAAAQERAALTGGAGFGGPLGAAVTGELVYGAGADVRDEGERVRGVAGLLVQVHAGSGGGKLSLGVGGRARIDSEDSAKHVSLSLGPLFRVGGAGGGAAVLFSWGLGVRF